MMANTVQKAKKLQKKAMSSLYERHATELLQLCSLMLQNEEAGASVATRTMNGVWKKLNRSACAEEREFRALLMAQAVGECAKAISVTSPQAFQPKKNMTAQVMERDSAGEYSGDINDAYNNIINAASLLTPAQRVILFAHTIGGLNGEQIAPALGMKDTAVNACYNAARQAFIRHLAQSSELQLAQLPSIAKQKLAQLTRSENMDAACRNMIDAEAKSIRPLRIVIPIGVVAVLLAIAIPVTLYFKDKPKEPVTTSDGAPETDTTQTDANETADNTENADAESKDDGTAAAATIASATDPGFTVTDYVDIEVENYGTITVALDHNLAPISVENFVNLVESGFYDGLTFHRIMDGFMLQGGDPDGTGTGGSGVSITGEFSDNGVENPISHTRGAISMARSEAKDSASSQFFIVQSDSTFLDGYYAGFGYVTEGMDIVDKICADANPTDENGTIEAADQPIIQKITARKPE